jgi:ribonuclease VapC
VSKFVLDASAIMAILNQEAGAEKLTPELLSDACVSAVNMAEVQTVLVNKGMAADDAWQDACSPVLEIAAFDHRQARLAGNLAGKTRSLGLSLGDRACLALASHLRAPVYTADRAWKKLNIGIEVRSIR